MDECHLKEAPVVTAGSTKVADSTTPWPLQGIGEPHENDVLCGRGGGTNNHLGNKRYRDLVKENNPNYAMAARTDKGPIVAAMVHSWRTTQDPPGRFLKKSVDDLWEDVGDKVAKEKTSQLFREIKVQGMKLKKNASGDEERSDDSLSGDKEPTKIAFREQIGTIDGSEPNLPPKQPVLRFVHSLGESSLEPGEHLSLHDFEWNEDLDPLPLSYVPFQTGDPSSSDTVLSDYDMVVPGSSAVNEEDAIEGIQSWRFCHADSPTQDDGRMVALPPMGPPQAIPPLQAEETYGSGSYHHGPRLSVPLTALNEAHSLGGFNLPGASILSQAVPFESRRSMTWEPISMPSSILMTTDKPGQHRNYARLVSDEELNDENRSILDLSLKHGAIQPSITTSPGGFTSESNAPLDIVSPVQGHCYVSSEIHGTVMINCSTDPYPRKVSDIDPVTMVQLCSSVANASDIGALHSSWSGEVPAPLNPFDSYNQHKSESELSRPDMVKRITSNQNEDETSKLGFASGSVKRAALNRDASARSNALKAQYVPDALRPDILEKRQVSVEEIDFLNDYFQQSRLNIDERPRPLTIDDRTNTDAVVLSVLTAGKPVCLSSINRRTTVEAILDDLGIDMDYDHNDDDGEVRPHQPSALSGEDCMSIATLRRTLLKWP